VGRALAHAGWILALVASALAVHGWIEQPWPVPDDLRGAWAMASALLGGCGALLSAFACVAAARGWRPRPLLLLAFPTAALLVAASGLLVEIQGLLSEYAELWSGKGQDVRVARLGGPGGGALYGAALGALWAAVGYAAAGAVPSLAPAGDGSGARPRFDPVAWTTGPLAAVALVAVFLLTYALLPRVILEYGLAQAISELGQTLDGLGTVRGAWFMLPQLPLVLVLLGLPLVLRPLYASIASAADERGTRAGLALASTLGLGGAGAFALLALGSARGLHFLTALLLGNVATKQQFLANIRVDGLRLGHTALPEAVAWLVLLAVLAVPVLAAAWADLRRAVAPVGLVSLAVLAAFGLRTANGVGVAADFGPVCERECSEVDRVSTLLRGAAPQWGHQMLYDPCSLTVMIPDDVRAPVVDTDNCPEVSVNVVVDADSVLLDGVRVGGLEALAHDGEAADALRFELEEKAEDALAIARRMPSLPMTGRYLLLVDASHDWATADAARIAAGEAGWCDAHFVVAAPGGHEPEWVRTVPTGLRRGSSPHPGNTCGLAIRADGYAVLTPAGHATDIPAGESPVNHLDALLGPHARNTTLVLCPDDHQRIENVLRLQVELEPRFDKVILDSVCDQVQIAGSPDRYCDRFTAEN